MEIKTASVDSVIIYFSDTISKDVSLLVKSAYKKLKEKEDLGFIEFIPSYTSLFLRYDIFKFDFETIKAFIKEELKDLEPLNEDSSKLIEIDVYYGEDVGLDLHRVASCAQISVDEVISLHSSKIYDVYAIGFLPGFAYLASIDNKLIVPRLDSPRKITPKGSVSIADNQTAIYPQNSPGGWNVLGRTAYELINKDLEELSPVSIDSRIKFNPISKEEFLDQGGVL